MIALAWAIGKPSISCVINGVRSVDQLKENIVTTQLNLGDEELSMLDECTDSLMKALGPSPDYYQSGRESKDMVRGPWR